VSAKHSGVEGKLLRLLEADFWKGLGSRAEQDIPVAADRSRGDQQSRLCCTNPFVAEPTQRFVPRFVPPGRKFFGVQPSNFEFVGNLAFDRYEVDRLEIWFEIYKVSTPASAKEVDA